MPGGVTGSQGSPLTTRVLVRRDGLPTNVVTDCASSVAENRAAVKLIACPGVSLAVAEVMYGVTLLGQAEPNEEGDGLGTAPVDHNDGHRPIRRVRERHD